MICILIASPLLGDFLLGSSSSSSEAVCATASVAFKPGSSTFHRGAR